jgi:hypothetical protein
MFQWGLNQGFVDQLLDSLMAPLQNWLSQYPPLLWLTTHPLWLLGAILLTLFLLSGLLRAVASLTEQLWLALLRLPITLVQWVWQGSLFLLKRPFASKALTQSKIQSNVAGSSALSSPDRLTDVLNRLETLRQEQDELLKEVKVLTKHQRNE